MVENVYRLFIDIIPYNKSIKNLKEEILNKDDIIKNGDDYEDQLETRKSINNHLKALATKIRNLPYIKSCNPDPSRNRGRGLSNYIEVQFNHPDGLTQDDIDRIYKYSY